MCWGMWAEWMLENQVRDFQRYGRESESLNSACGSENGHEVLEWTSNQELQIC